MHITFSKPTLFCLFLFIHGGSLVLRSYLMEFAIKNRLNTAILTLLMMIGEMIGGILLYIYKRTIKTKKAMKILNPINRQSSGAAAALNSSNRKTFSPVHEKPNHKKDVVTTYLIIFGLAGVDALVMYSQYAFIITKNSSFYNFQLKVFIQIFNTIFTSLVLHIKLFRHHLSGIALVVIGLFLTNFNHVLVMNSDILDELTFCIEILLAIGYSILEVNHKRVMNNKYIEPYRLLFFVGLFGICVLGLFCGLANIIYAFVPESEFIGSIKHDFDAFGLLFSNAGIFFSGIGYLILSAVVNISFVLINYFYNPISRIMTDINSYFFLWLVGAISNPIDGHFILMALIGLIIQLIGMLLYHEMIIVHLLGCDTFTKAEITNRGNEEIENAVLELEQEKEIGPLDDKDLIHELM